MKEYLSARKRRNENKESKTKRFLNEAKVDIRQGKHKNNALLVEFIDKKKKKKGKKNATRVFLAFQPQSKTWSVTKRTAN